MFLVVRVKKKFVKINGLKISLITKLGNASYWTNKKDLNTWLRAIKAKYPDCEVREVEFTLKKK